MRWAFTTPGREGTVASFIANGRRIAMVAFAPNVGSNSLNDPQIGLPLVADLAAKHDIVIVSFHGGAEGNGAEVLPFAREIFAGEDRGNVVEFAHAMIDAGADIVLGHGPHVVRPLEIYKDRLIAYSLGNFATYYGISVEGIRGIAPILLVTLDDEGRFVRREDRADDADAARRARDRPGKQGDHAAADAYYRGVSGRKPVDRRGRHADEERTGALMRRLLRWLGGATAAGVARRCWRWEAGCTCAAKLACVLSTVRHRSRWRFLTTMPRRVRGDHLVRTRGCRGCHGDNLGGQLMWGYAVATEPHERSPAMSRAADFEAALRHGIDHTGRAMYDMPSYNFLRLRDADVADIIAYLRAAPLVKEKLPSASLSVVHTLESRAGSGRAHRRHPPQGASRLNTPAAIRQPGARRVSRHDHLHRMPRPDVACRLAVRRRDRAEPRDHCGL